MTEVHGTGFPRDGHAEEREPVVLAPESREPPLTGDPEWVEILRGLGLAACLFSALVLAPCAVMAIAAGDWPAPWPVRFAAVVVATVGISTLFAIGIGRALHGPDVDWR